MIRFSNFSHGGFGRYPAVTGPSNGVTFPPPSCLSRQTTCLAHADPKLRHQMDKRVAMAL
jgi:hypothetical protein